MEATNFTYNEKIRWLRRYRDALRLEEELRQELKAQRARACKTTAALTGMPGAAPCGGKHRDCPAGAAGTDQSLRGDPARGGGGAGPGYRCAGP